MVDVKFRGKSWVDPGWRLHPKTILCPVVDSIHHSLLVSRELEYTQSRHVGPDLQQARYRSHCITYLGQCLGRVLGQLSIFLHINFGGFESGVRFEGHVRKLVADFASLKVCDEHPPFASLVSSGCPTNTVNVLLLRRW